MATMIIDGATGGKQIYPYMEAASNASLTGKMDCVPNNFDDSTKPFDPVMVSNNEISVSSGIGYLQGRRFIVDGAESVLVSNGISGAKRYTYIVAEYNATEAGIESVVLNTVDGEANGTIDQLDAQLAKGSVDAGEKYQMPLVLILKNGLDIESVDVAYDSVATLKSVTNGLIVLEEKTIAFSGNIKADDVVTVTNINIAKPGYKFAGVTQIQFNGTNASALVPALWKEHDGVLWFRARNVHPSWVVSSASANVTLLYIKNV